MLHHETYDERARQQLTQSAQNHQCWNEEEFQFYIKIAGHNPRDFLCSSRIDSRLIESVLSASAIPLEDYISTWVPKLIADNTQQRSWHRRWLAASYRYYGSPFVEWVAGQLGSAAWSEATKFAVVEAFASESDLIKIDLHNAPLEWRDRRIMHRHEFEFQRDREAAHSALARALDKYHARHSSLRSLQLYLQDHLRPSGANFISPRARTWLGSATLEAILFDMFSMTSEDVVAHYMSQEVMITGAFVASLRMRGQQLQDKLRTLWQLAFGNSTCSLKIVDCQRHYDVGGADLALVLEIDVPSFQRRHTVAAFQAKKVATNHSLSLSSREVAQLEKLQQTTSSAYYVLYLHGRDQAPPVVVPARVIAATRSSGHFRSVPMSVLLPAARSLADYVVFDMLAGWSGEDVSTPQTKKLLEAALAPLQILTIRLSAVLSPPEEERTRRDDR